MVGDAGVEVHAAVVVGGLDVVGHRRGLGVLAELGVVVGGAGRLHRAQRHPLDLRGEQAGPDQPVGRGGVLAEGLLLDQRPEHVGDALVERARLALVDQRRRVLGDPVGELVADHVDRDGEPVEDGAVAVAEDHLGAVPERVVVATAVVHRAEQREPLAVEGVAAVGLVEQGSRSGRTRRRPRRPRGRRSPAAPRCAPSCRGWSGCPRRRRWCAAGRCRRRRAEPRSRPGAAPGGRSSTRCAGRRRTGARAACGRARATGGRTRRPPRRRDRSGRPAGRAGRSCSERWLGDAVMPHGAPRCRHPLPVADDVTPLPVARRRARVDTARWKSSQGRECLGAARPGGCE